MRKYSTNVESSKAFSVTYIEMHVQGKILIDGFSGLNERRAR